MPTWHTAPVAPTQLQGWLALPVPPAALPERWMLCAEVFMLHKPNHAHQDNLWLPLNEENSSTFLCQARLGSWPQTLDPLLTPRFPWVTASVGVEERHPRLVRLCLPCGAALRETGSWPLRQPERGKNVVPSILSNSSATRKGHRPSPPVVYAPQQTLLHASNHSTFIIWFNPRPSFPPFFPVTPSGWEGWGRRALGQELPRRLGQRWRGER